MTSILNGAISAFLPTLIEIASLLVMAWLVRLSVFMKEKWGIEIEARHREALHSAILTGIRAALEKGLTRDQVITAAIEHVSASVPDAISALRPASGVLENLIAAKLKEVLAS